MISRALLSRIALSAALDGIQEPIEVQRAEKA